MTPPFRTKARPQPGHGAALPSRPKQRGQIVPTPISAGRYTSRGSLESLVRRLLTAYRSRFGTCIELRKALCDGPYCWLVPVVLLLLPAALILIFLQAAPLVAPFVYTVM